MYSSKSETPDGLTVIAVTCTCAAGCATAKVVTTRLSANVRPEAIQLFISEQSFRRLDTDPASAGCHLGDLSCGRSICQDAPSNQRALSPRWWAIDLTTARRMHACSREPTISKTQVLAYSRGIDCKVAGAD